MIHDQYLDKIIYVIEGSSIRRKELKDDLVDHFCCLVEMDMDRGLDFDAAFKKAYEQTCPNGLDEIQKETVFLLNYNRIMFMKRLTYLIGFLASLAVSAGFLFRIFHWPGASDLLLVGFGGLGLLFLPLILVDRFKHLASQASIEKVKLVFGILSAVMFTTGGIFKILHLPTAMILIGLSFLFFCLGFLPLLFFRMYKKSVEQL